MKKVVGIEHEECKLAARIAGRAAWDEYASVHVLEAVQCYISYMIMY
jgi:hypothetical protein